MVCEPRDLCRLHTPGLGHSSTPSKSHCSSSPIPLPQGPGLGGFFTPSKPHFSSLSPLTLGPGTWRLLSLFETLLVLPAVYFLQPHSPASSTSNPVQSFNFSNSLSRTPAKCFVDLRRSRPAASFKGRHLIIFSPFSCNTKGIFNHDLTHHTLSPVRHLILDLLCRAVVARHLLSKS